MTEPKFQISVFLDPEKREQIVIRGDNQKDFILDCEWANTNFNAGIVLHKTPITNATDDPSESENPSSDHFCEKHQALLELRYSKTKFTKEGKPKPYYAHMAEGKMCFGE